MKAEITLCTIDGDDALSITMPSGFTWYALISPVARKVAEQHGVAWLTHDELVRQTDKLPDGAVPGVK